MAQFRLQRILDYRQRREEQMRQRFGAAVSARVRAEQDLAVLEAVVERERASLGRLFAEARVDIGALRDRNAALELYARAVETQREAVARALAFEAEERAHLTAAMADRKALDNLRDRHIERERREDLRKEALILDEVAGRRALSERLAAAG
jgi:flagellar export protein FliJ